MRGEQRETRGRRHFPALRLMILTLGHHGVTHFATANVKHFGSFGFAKLWNPLTSSNRAIDPN